MKRRDQKKKKDYESKNRDFIVTNAGISKYRTLRVYLILREKDERLVYDVIVPKKSKETNKLKKLQRNRELKARLGALNSQEYEEINYELNKQIQFYKNPFFYAEIPDLLEDLNFKNYYFTLFNSVFLPDFKQITSFSQIDEAHQDVFTSEINTEHDKFRVFNTIKQIMNEKNIRKQMFLFEDKNILDQHNIPYYLENFAETQEFYEGCDPICREKVKISPVSRITNVDFNETRGRLTDSQAREIKFAKSLNNNPLRNKKDSISILPPLPQRFLLDKKAFKAPNFRRLFLDHYSHPVIVKEKEDNFIPMNTLDSESTERSKKLDKVLDEDLNNSGLGSSFQIKTVTDSYGREKKIAHIPETSLLEKKAKGEIDVDLQILNKRREDKKKNMYNFEATSKYISLFYNTDKFKDKITKINATGVSSTKHQKQKAGHIYHIKKPNLQSQAEKHKKSVVEKPKRSEEDHSTGVTGEGILKEESKKIPSTKAEANKKKLSKEQGVNIGIDQTHSQNTFSEEPIEATPSFLNEKTLNANASTNIKNSKKNAGGNIEMPGMNRVSPFQKHPLPKTSLPMIPPTYGNQPLQRRNNAYHVQSHPNLKFAQRGPNAKNKFSLDFNLLQKIKEGFRLNAVAIINTQMKEIHHSRVMQQKYAKTNNALQPTLSKSPHSQSFLPSAADAFSSSTVSQANENAQVTKQHIDGMHTVQLIKRFRKKQIYNNIIYNYKFSLEKFEKILKQFFFLYKVSLFLQNFYKPSFKSSEMERAFHPRTSPGKSFGKKQTMESTQADFHCDEKFTKRAIEEITLSSNEYASFLEIDDPSMLNIQVHVLKYYFHIFRKKSSHIFNRILLALDINLNSHKNIQQDSETKIISIIEFSKIRYYLLDKFATHQEIINFCLKFLMPSSASTITISDILRILKELILETNNSGQGEIILKALISNFILCGIIDDDGCFSPSIFSEVYSGRKMQIADLFAIIINK